MTLRPGIERRITLRLLAYWEKLRGDRPMPAEEDINPDDIEDLWDSCLLIHVKDLLKEDYNYTYLGEAIAEAYTSGFSKEELNEEGMLSPNANKLAHSYARVIATMKPVLEEGEFRNAHNEVVKYRQCLVPLGDDGEVKAIFGGMRFKIFTMAEENKEKTAG